MSYGCLFNGKHAYVFDFRTVALGLNTLDGVLFDTGHGRELFFDD